MAEMYNLYSMFNFLQPDPLEMQMEANAAFVSGDFARAESRYLLSLSLTEAEARKIYGEELFATARATVTADNCLQRFQSIISVTVERASGGYTILSQAAQLLHFIALCYAERDDFLTADRLFTAARPHYLDLRDGRGVLLTLSQNSSTERYNLEATYRRFLEQVTRSHGVRSACAATLQELIASYPSHRAMKPQEGEGNSDLDEAESLYRSAMSVREELGQFAIERSDLQALQTLMIQAKDRGRATKPFDNKAMSVELAKVSERAEDFAAASGYWFVAARNNNDVNQVIDFLEHSIDAYKKVEPDNGGKPSSKMIERLRSLAYAYRRAGRAADANACMDRVSKPQEQND